MAGERLSLREKLCYALGDASANIAWRGICTFLLVFYTDVVGLKAAAEYFTDRAYEADGSLRNHRLPGAMITDEEEAIARTIRMIRENKVRTYDGQDLTLNAASVCVHGDGVKALAFVRKIRERLGEEGIAIKPLCEIMA